LAGQNASFNVIASGIGLGYQWLLNNSPISGAAAPVFNLTNISPSYAGSYAVMVTNVYGAVTSGIATLTVLPPPTLKLGSSTTGNLQLSANSITGLTYVVEAATNLLHPVWIPVLTNTTGSDGAASFQTNAAGATWQFYRLVFP
jgi:hypothetical protein